MGVNLYFRACVATALRTALIPSISRSAACTIWTERAVSITSELVMPLWMKREDGPTNSATLVRKAMTSWLTSRSIASIRATSNFARFWIRLRSAAGITPSLCCASQASTSIFSQMLNRFSSVQMLPIAGLVYLGIMASHCSLKRPRR